jgi:hypothetical protein
MTNVCRAKQSSGVFCRKVTLCKHNISTEAFKKKKLQASLEKSNYFNLWMGKSDQVGMNGGWHQTLLQGFT